MLNMGEDDTFFINGHIFSFFNLGLDDADADYWLFIWLQIG